MSNGDSHIQNSPIVDEGNEFDDIVLFDSNANHDSGDVNFEANDFEVFEFIDSEGDCVFVPENYCVGVQSINTAGEKFWTPTVDDSIRPKIGMEFDTIEDAFTFYNEYAIQGGFEAIKSSSKWSTDDSGNMYISHKYFLCSKNGVKVVKDKKSKISPPSAEISDADFGEGESTIDKDIQKKKPKKRKRPSQKVGCYACFVLHHNSNNKYQVNKFTEKHNHILVPPQHIKHLKSQRKLSKSQKCFLFQLGQSGIGPNVGYRVLTKVHGGHDLVGASKTDCKNWKRDVNKYILKADAEMLVQMLNAKKKCQIDFSFEYFTVLKDERQELAGAFWADATSKRNFKSFGDVVSFDATFRTNRYDMVFIPFTGIDNHCRCVTFGAGLLKKEDVASYDWLLKAFKKAFPVEPQIVMTDQDPAMAIAVQYVFLTARHRLCMWHITEKITSKVGHAISKSGFKYDISNIIWTDKLDPNDFDRRWFSILHRYNLDGNKWLSDLFNIRDKWIPTYFRDWEMFGLMRTSSRSESENHVFQQLMSRSSTLVEFIGFFETAMQIQRYEQSKNDHDCLTTIPDIETQHPMEKHAARLFTRAIFWKIQAQMKASVRYCMSYQIKKFSKDTTIFYIGDTSVKTSNIDETIDRIENPYYFDELVPRYSQVLVNRTRNEISCSCKMYERLGYLCRHILYVLKMDAVPRVRFPSKYVNKRWSLQSIHLDDPRSSSLRNQTGTLGSYIKDIYSNVDQCVRLNMRDPEKMKVFRDLIKDLKDKVFSEPRETSMMGSDDLIPALVGIPQPGDINVHAPENVRNKGCGNKRITNAREEAINQKDPAYHRKCSHCGGEKHNVRSCPVLKEKELEEKFKRQELKEKQIAEENAKRAANVENEECSDSRSEIGAPVDIHCPPSKFPRTVQEVINRAKSGVLRGETSKKSTY